jgi:hypothetical protein
MKKLALLFGGEFRNFSQCFQTWEPMRKDYDIFLSTWSISNWYSDNSTYLPQRNNRTFDVTEETVLSIVGEPLKYLNIEKPINFPHRGNKQIYHWHRLLTALINVQYEYEYALITRPDASIVNPLEFWKIFDNPPSDKLFGASEVIGTPPPKPYPITIADWFFLSTPTNLINILLSVPYMKICTPYEVERLLGDNFHTHLAYYFVNNNHYVYNMPNSGNIIVDSLDKKMLRNRERGHDLFAGSPHQTTLDKL